MMDLLWSKLVRILRPSSRRARSASWQAYLDRVDQAAESGHFDQIEGHLNQTRQWLETLPPSDPQTLEWWVRLGEIYQEVTGDNPKAEEVYRKALENSERSGSDDMRVALPANALGLFLVQQRRYSEAEPLFERLLTLVRRHFGEEHPETATCLENLAAIYRQTDRGESAQQIRAEARRIRLNARKKNGSLSSS